MRATGAWPMPKRNRAQPGPHRCFLIEHYDFSGARISKHVRDQNMGIFNRLFFLLAVQPDQAASCPGRTDR